MTTEELKERFRKFSIRVVRMVNAMPNTIAGNAIAKQVIRSGTSSAANYSAACLAKSNKDFLNKLKIVEEEIDETAHWMSIIIDAELMQANLVTPLYEEAIELKRIVVRSIKTIKQTIDAQERIVE